MNENHFPVELPERLLKATEVAKILNISRALAYQMMQRGEIRTVSIRTSVRVRPEDLENFIQSNLTPSPES